MQIITVLRSGGEYTAKHAQALAAQINEHAFPHTLWVMSDMDFPGVDIIPLRHNWPGWWSKMEMFWLADDLLYFDLDTVLTASLLEIVEADRLTVLRDPYWQRRQDPTRIGSGVMFIPHTEHEAVWQKWIANPEQHMRDFARGGDQAFLRTLWGDRAARWQDLLPGQLTSYKAEKRGPDTRVLYFHGKPRPWAVPEFQHLYEEAA